MMIEAITWPRVIFSILVDNRRIEDNLDRGDGLADLRWEHSLDMPLEYAGAYDNELHLITLREFSLALLFSHERRDPRSLTASADHLHWPTV